jgi:hypothetical protein
MTAIIAILACAALAVVFGLFVRPKPSCGSSAQCDSCVASCHLTESNHDHA